jgi:hypothetical protein
MKDRDLDNLFRDKLGQIKRSPSEGDWDIFEKRYEAEEQFDEMTEDIHFDHHIAEKTARISIKSPSQWPKLQSDLMIIDSRRRAVWHYKATETAIVLLIMYCASILPSNIWELQTPKSPKAPATKIINRSEIAESSWKEVSADKQQNITTVDKDVRNTTQQTLVENTRQETVTTEISISNIGGLDSDLAASTISVEPTIASIDQAARKIENLAIQPNNKQITNEAIKQEIAIASDLNLEEINKNPAQITQNLADSGSASDHNVSENQAIQIQAIPVSATPAISSQSERTTIAVATLDRSLPNVESEFALAFPMRSSTLKKNNYTIAGAWVSRDINMINTPFDKIYALASYQKEALNYSMGINISRKKDRSEVISGVEYAKRSYQPRQFSEKVNINQDYYYESSLDKISYDLLTIPLKFKFDYVASSKWKAYVTVGAALNLVLNANYNITKDLVENISNNAILPQSGGRLQSKNFIAGIANDSTDDDLRKLAGVQSAKFISSSNLSDNYFVGLSFGLGLEKQLTKRSSLYLEPSYQRHVFSKDIGIGPNKDKIHTSSLQLGIRTILL